MIQNSVFTALDLGTNTTLMLNAVEQSNGQLGEVEEFCRSTRLGEKLTETGVLQPLAVTRTLNAVQDFVQRTREFHPDGIGIAVATSAVRDASNREVFLSSFEQLMGARPVVLDGAEEARAVFAGASSDQEDDCFLLCLDIGGGSTEIAGGYRGDCRFCISADVGCVRFGERYDLFEETDPEVIAAAGAAIQDELRKACTDCDGMIDRNQPVKVLVSGGTATTYAAYRQEMLRYDRVHIHGFCSHQEVLARDIMELAEISSRQRAQKPGIAPDRAPVLPAGLLILQEFLRLYEIESFSVTTRGLRYGIVSLLHAGVYSPTWSWSSARPSA